MVESISIFELKKLKSITIIDIRNSDRYNNGHIEGSINIPLEKLLANFYKYLKKSETYYVYCQMGIRSRKVCQILKKNGFNVINIEGGYETYILSE